MELGSLPDIVHSDILNIDDMPDKAVAVIAYRALGLSMKKIARLTGVTKQTVSEYLKRYDPKSLCTVTQEQKRMITSEMMLGIGVEALTEITEAKLISMDAQQLSQIATRCVGAAEKIRALDKGLKQKKTELDSAMDYIDASYEEVDG